MNHTYSALNMTMENNEQAAKAAEIIREIASNRTPEYPEEMTSFIAEVEIRSNMIVVPVDNILEGNTFEDLLPEIMKACAALTQSSFEANAYAYSTNCGYDAFVTAVRNGNEVEIVSGESESGNGICPECGVTVVYYDEYDPNAIYRCPECGEVLDHYEMFEGYLPKIHKETVVLLK